MQRAKYDIGEEAVHRFSLPPEDKASLELVEWVDGAFKRASVCFEILLVNTCFNLDFIRLFALYFIIFIFWSHFLHCRCP